MCSCFSPLALRSACACTLLSFSNSSRVLPSSSTSHFAVFSLHRVPELTACLLPSAFFVFFSLCSSPHLPRLCRRLVFACHLHLHISAPRRACKLVCVCPCVRTSLLRLLSARAYLLALWTSASPSHTPSHVFIIFHSLVSAGHLLFLPLSLTV